MRDVIRSIGLGFAGLLRFRGRDGRARFWHYAGFVLIVTQVVGVAVMMMPIMARVQRYALEQADRATVAGGPDPASVAFEGVPPFMKTLMSDILAASAILTAVTVLLLAAAVARRLHDVDRRGAWGLLPLPFLAAGPVLMIRAMAGFERRPQPDLTPFLALFLNNLAYLGLLGLLVYFLVIRGTPGPNRFGPPPG